MWDIRTFCFTSDKQLHRLWEDLAEPETDLRIGCGIYAQSMTTKGLSCRKEMMWMQMILSVYYRKVYPLSFTESIRKEQNMAGTMPSIQEED